MKVLDLFKWKENPQGEFYTTKHKDRGNFLLSILKNNKNEILFVKILTLIIVNTWLLINNVNMINNVVVTKMNTLLQPLMHNNLTLCLTVGLAAIIVGYKVANADKKEIAKIINPEIQTYENIINAEDILVKYQFQNAKTILEQQSILLNLLKKIQLYLKNVE